MERDTGIDREVARRIAARGFNHGDAYRNARAIEDRPATISNRSITEEEWEERRHVEKHGYAPMQGLPDVDYSDIFTEFDSLSGAHKTDCGRWEEYNHLPSDGFSYLSIREKGGSLTAQATRAENKIYGYANLGGRKRPMNMYGTGRVGLGFVDALYSVVKDVDVYDPVNEMDIFLKFMLIKADFVGGQCHFCKSPNATIVGVEGTDGFRYVYKCDQCTKPFRPKSGSLFHKCRRPLSALMDCVNMSLDLKGVPVRTMAKRLDVMPNTAFALRTIIRTNSIIADRWPNEHEGDSVPHGRTKPIKIYSLEDLKSLAR